MEVFNGVFKVFEILWQSVNLIRLNVEKGLTQLNIV